MALPNVFLLAHGSLYVFAFILSFFICVPTGVNVNDFNGHCLLHATGDWKLEKNQQQPHLKNIVWGVESACNFTIFIGVMSLMLALFYAFWSFILWAKGRESSWVDVLLNLIVNSVMCVCIFSDAVTVSVGFGRWCDLITDPKSGIDSCEDGQRRYIIRDINIHYHNYFPQWQCVQFGAWCSWVTWLILSVMSFGRMVNYHRREAFSICINRERQRLLQKVAHAYDPIDPLANNSYEYEKQGRMTGSSFDQ